MEYPTKHWQITHLKSLDLEANLMHEELRGKNISCIGVGWEDMVIFLSQGLKRGNKPDGMRS